MLVFSDEPVVYYDVDDTLVHWGSQSDYSGERVVEFENPYDGSLCLLTPIEEHISLMRQHRERGYKICVWSAGGALWAKEVILKLGLEDLVDIVMTKPTLYVDDLDAKEFMGTRVYLLKQPYVAKYSFDDGTF